MSSVQFQGLDIALARLRATEPALARAQRNAINVTATQTKRVLVRMLGSGLQIKQKPIRSALVVKRAGRRRDFATIYAAGTLIPLKEWKWRYVSTDHPTRAYVQVFDGLSGPPSIAYAFVNPRGKGRVPLVRRAAEISKARGRSIRRAFGQAIERGAIVDFAKTQLSENLAKKLADQARRRAA